MESIEDCREDAIVNFYIIKASLNFKHEFLPSIIFIFTTHLAFIIS